MSLRAQEEWLENNKTTASQISSLTAAQEEWINSNQVDQTVAPEQQPAPTQRWRSLAQGLTFGFADEIEGFVRSAFSKDTTYEDVRNEVRNKLSAYVEEHPKEALALEVIGAIAPTVVSLFGGPAGWAVVVRTAATLGTKMTGRSSVKQMAHMGGKAGAAYSVGTGEEGFVSDLANIPKGYIAGGATGAVLAKSTNLVGAGINKLMDKGRGVVVGIQALIKKADDIGGEKVADPVRREIQRLAEGTGLTPDEVVAKVASGEIMAENKTLESVMRVLRSELGGDTSQIHKELSKRPLQTKTRALDTMQKSLGLGDTNQNTIKLWQASEEVASKQLSKLYRNLFKTTNPELPKEVAETLIEMVRRLPNAREILKEINQTRGNFVPVFKISKNGTISFNKVPRLEDGETIYKAIRDKADDLFNARQNQTVATALSENAKAIKATLDKFSPELSAVRAHAKTLIDARQAYKLGKKALSQNPEELEILLEKYASSPKSMEAFQSAVMSIIKKSSGSSPTLMGKIAQEGTNQNKIVRMAFPEKSIADILSQTKIAGQANYAFGQIMGGSGTTPQSVAEKAAQQAGLMYRASQGDPIAAMQLVMRRIESGRPALKPEHRAEVVKVLLSQDPKVVQKALIDDNAMNMLQKVIDEILYGLGKAATAVTSRFAGEKVGEIDTGLLNMTTGMIPSSAGMKRFH